MKPGNKLKKVPKKRGKKLVMVSGGFDPVHIGHVRMFEEAKILAKKIKAKLLVVVNSDAWLIRKKGKNFMSSGDRAEIIRNFRAVDYVWVLESDENHVVEAIKKWKPVIFANGGDRKEEKDIPEAIICKELGVKMVFNVGEGGKIRSSSELLKKY